MLKLHAGVSKKVGLPGFSSASASCTIEAELGDIAIVGVPAEFFTVLGQEIKRRSPFRRTLVAELSGDWIGYLPDRLGHRLGGYQTWTGHHSYAEPGTGERVVAAALEQLDRLHAAAAPGADR